MKLLIQLFLIFFLGCLAMWLFRKLLWACIKLSVLIHAQKHPEDIPRTEGLVFNKKTKKLEPDSQPILPGE